MSIASQPNRADVVDQHVDSPMLSDRSANELGGRVGNRQVERHRRHPFPLLETFRIPGRGDHIGAFRRQRLGDGQPDSLACTGDHRDLLVQHQIHHSSLLGPLALADSIGGGIFTLRCVAREKSPMGSVEVTNAV
jgi:hypothetical protein